MMLARFLTLRKQALNDEVGVFAAATNCRMPRAPA